MFMNVTRLILQSRTTLAQEHVYSDPLSLSINWWFVELSMRFADGFLAFVLEDEGELCVITF